MEKIKVVVFDIGGVLLENPFIGEFWKNISGSKELRDVFGRGKMPKKEFIEKASKIIQIPKNKFIKEYSKAYFPIRKIEKTFEIYTNLKLKKALFSNTNPLHLEFIKKRYPNLFKLADKTFMSSEIGSRKSQEESYKHLIKGLKVKPQEILLIDDKEEVVTLAKKYRINTILFKNSNQLKKDMVKLGLK